MYIGIDHGTTYIRFATDQGKQFKMSRKEATNFVIDDLSKLCELDEICGISLSYSMGDNFTEIKPIDDLNNRGVISKEVAGKHVGGGTHVFDTIKTSKIPTIVVPGIHRGSDTDPRFKIYSHQTSPEKIGIAYLVSKTLGKSFIISDVSSNTVSLLVSQGKIVGAFDACIFAPGMSHGALDVNAIRNIDSGNCTANDAFSRAGVKYNLDDKYQLPTLALWTAMECASLGILAPSASIALTGSLAPKISEEVSALIRKPVIVYDEWAAANGMAMIAHDVFTGITDILGIKVSDSIKSIIQ